MLQQGPRACKYIASYGVHMCSLGFDLVAAINKIFFFKYAEHASQKGGAEGSVCARICVCVYIYISHSICFG